MEGVDFGVGDGDPFMLVMLMLGKLENHCICILSLGFDGDMGAAG